LRVEKKVHRADGRGAELEEALDFATINSLFAR
jgi:hypothetical protein